MVTLSPPNCPKCIDGGTVTLVEITNEAESVFYPLPDGERGSTREWQCECGWSQAEPDQPAASGKH
jgi:hypothetical protein